ncbi:hypothetical protein GCM10027168_62970 [Streptomyces capparidis]
MDWDTVVHELYGLRPERFTAVRDERAREARRAGRRDLAERVAALRRPTLAAWASNLLVRAEPAEAAALVELGQALRDAHRVLDGGRLRELSRRQGAVVAGLSRRARRLAAGAGHPLGDDAQREVEQTLRAALADPEAARAWAEGRLVAPLSPATGLPAADVAAARRPASRPARPARPDRRREAEQARARREKEEAEREVAARREGQAAARRELERAVRERERCERRAAGLREELARAEAEQRAAAERERERRDLLRQADRALRSASAAAERAGAAGGDRAPGGGGPG